MPGGFAVALLMGGRSRRMGVDKAMEGLINLFPKRGPMRWRKEIHDRCDEEVRRSVLGMFMIRQRMGGMGFPKGVRGNTRMGLQGCWRC